VRAARTAALPLAAALAACAGAQIKWTQDDGTDALRIKAVAVMPFAYRWDEPAHRYWTRSLDLIDALIAERRFLVVGPTEFKIYKPDDDNLLAATTLAGAMMQRGVRPAEFLAVRARAERRLASGAQEVQSTSGGTARSLRNDDITLVATVELLHPHSHRILIEATASQKLDPFAERDPADPHPELRALLQRLVHESLERLDAAKRLDAPMLARDPGMTVVPNPRAAVLFEPPGLLPFTKDLEKLDVLDQDVAKLDAYRSVDPKVDVARRRKYDRHPHGLLVTFVRPELLTTGIKPGDFILEIDDEPAVGPQVLWRRLYLAPPGGSMRLKIMRGDDAVAVSMPADALLPKTGP
jgi:hypothetical protein